MIHKEKPDSSVLGSTENWNVSYHKIAICIQSNWWISCNAHVLATDYKTVIMALS